MSNVRQQLFCESPTITLDEIVDLLDRHQQRAAYGAVADLLGKPAKFLMSGLERAPRYSWVVNKKTLLPTGYSPEEQHPALQESSFVLLDATSLHDWIARKQSNQKRS